VRGLCNLPGVGFVSASHDTTLRVWSMEGETLATLAGHTALVYACAAAPNGTIASGACLVTRCNPAGSPHMPTSAVCLREALSASSVLDAAVHGRLTFCLHDQLTPGRARACRLRGQHVQAVERRRRVPADRRAAGLRLERRV
jgi:hypothetical protein